MSTSTSPQTITIGYLGPDASHSHHAALTWARHMGLAENTLTPDAPTVQWKAFPTLGRLMAETEDGTLDLGIVPFENALEGSVVEVLETLSLQQRHIVPCCEFLFPIRHCLIQPTQDTEIRAVISHPQALAQCRKSLRARFGDDVELEWAPSTSEAVQRLREPEHAHKAALGSAAAAQQAGMIILEEDLSDTPDNQTRFYVLSRHPGLDSQPLLQSIADYPRKTSLCFGVPERPGALVDVLQIMKQYDLNMTKIESRPSKKQFGEYMFHVDLDRDLSEPKFKNLIPCLRDFTHNLEILGPYVTLGVLDFKAQTPLPTQVKS